jgi:GNAT superfamily N-acetyltransferase
VSTSTAGGPSVRRAVRADARRIAEINVAAWRAAYDGQMPADFLRSLGVEAREIAWQSLLESDADDRAPAWVAVAGDEVVGYLASGPARDEATGTLDAEVYAIYVHPQHWRSGAGRRLMAAAIDEWTARGAAALVLWVLEANAAARSFYESQGWRPDGSRQEIDLGGFAVVEVRYRRPIAHAA